ncbi:MAG: ABC transporter ATP-binding protein [bacterium]
MKSYLRLLKLIKPYRKALLGAFLCSVAYALANAIAIWFSASFITAIFTPDANPIGALAAAETSDLNEKLKIIAWNFIGEGDRFDVVKRAVVIFFFAYFLRNFFVVAQLFFISFIEQRVIRDIRDKLYSHLLKQALSFFHKRKAGELASIALNDVALLNDKMMKAIKFSMREPFVIIIFMFLLFTISWKLTLVTLIVLPFAGIMIDKLGRSLRRKSRRMQEAMSDLTSLIYERLGGIRLIKIAGTEAPETDRFKSVTATFFRQALRQRRLDFLTAPATEILGMAIISVILLYGGYLVFQTTAIDAEDFVRFIAILFSIMAPAKGLGDAYTSIQVASASADRIYGILDVDEKLIIPDKIYPVTGFDSSLVLENVNFRYDTAETNALTDINITIKQGESVALVGPSGAGKTTLIGLLIRLFDPTSGIITLDGKDLKILDSVALRKRFGVVSQDIILFNDSIAANIGYGADNVPQEKIEYSAKLAYAHDFISAFPDGYQTEVGDRGVRLSGGQQQRLSIARALVHDPPIIIFDEATSNLDSESESLIQQAMESLRSKHTLILIAHRLATIRNADRIVVLDQGRIIDKGTYDELHERCALFKRLCQQQFLAE